MFISRPHLRQPVRVRRPQPRVPAPRAPFAIGAATLVPRTPKSWHWERRRRAIAAVTVAFVLGGLLSGYAVHVQMSHAASRAEARKMQSAIATATALKSGTVLFVPGYGNVCRRRFIDNATWTMRDGGEIGCDAEVAWNAVLPAPQYKIEKRLGAIRDVFQSKAAGKLD
jgi:hypothetical protein